MVDPIVKDWAEFAGYLANVAVAVAAIIALQQITILKRDIRLRNQRAAGEKAMEAVDKYGAFANQAFAYFQDLRREDAPTYKGPVGDFTPSSVPPEWSDAVKKRVRISTWIPAVNTLDTVAASFIFGVADESTGFAMIGRSFCANVGHFYDLIARQRKDTVQPHFQAIVQLYTIWANRLSKEELQKARTALDAQIERLPNNKIAPIGVSEN